MEGVLDDGDEKVGVDMVKGEFMKVEGLKGMKGELVCDGGVWKEVGKMGEGG